MNCPNCGSPLADSNSFCQQCGGQAPDGPSPEETDPFDVEPLFEDLERRPEAPRKAMASVPEPTPPPQHSQGARPAAKAVPPPKTDGRSKGPLIILIVLAILALLTAAALGFGLLSPKEKQPAPETPSQTITDGQMGEETETPEAEQPKENHAEAEEPPETPPADTQPEKPQYAYGYLGMTTAQVIQLLGEDYSSEYWNGSDSLFYPEEGLMLFFGHTGKPQPEDTITAVLGSGQLPACPGVSAGQTLEALETALGQDLTTEYSPEDGVETAYCELNGYSLLLFQDINQADQWLLGYYLVK